MEQEFYELTKWAFGDITFEEWQAKVKERYDSYSERKDNPKSKERWMSSVSKAIK